jgi:hypothetical protein
LRFENNEEIKVHSMFLKNIGYFQFITENCNMSSIITEKVLLDYNYTRRVIDYLYVSDKDRWDGEINYVLFVDSLDMYDNNSYLHSLLTIRYPYKWREYMSDCFGNNNFDEFCHKISIYTDIAEKLMLHDTCDRVFTWLLDNVNKYNIYTLKKLPLFKKKYNYTIEQKIISSTVGASLIAKLKLYTLFTDVLDENNFESLLDVIIKDDFINCWDLLSKMCNKIKCSNKTIKNASNAVKILFYIFNERYYGLNRMFNVGDGDFKFLVDLMAKRLKDKNWGYLQKVMFHDKNTKIIRMKNSYCCRDITNYIHVNSFHPLDFAQYLYIGSFATVIYDPNSSVFIGNGKITGIHANLAHSDKYIKVGDELYVTVANVGIILKIKELEYDRQKMSIAFCHELPKLNIYFEDNSECKLLNDLRGNRLIYCKIYSC